MANMINLVPKHFGQRWNSNYEFGQTEVEVHHKTVRHTVDPDFENSKSNLPCGTLITTMENKLDPSDSKRFKTVWAHNPKTGCVISKLDKETKHTHMMRVHIDADDNSTVCYAGRADTPYRIKQQVAFMINAELSLQGKVKSLKDVKGLEKVKDGDNLYKFTYGLGTLTQIGELQNFKKFDERKSIEQERIAIEEVGIFEVDLNGVKINVAINPIHVHFNVGLNGEIISALFDDKVSGADLEKEINDIGYHDLFDLMDTDSEFEKLTKEKLRERSKLSLKERFIYTDLCFKYLDLPIVYHCKSCTDRYVEAQSISAALTEIPKSALESTESLDAYFESEDFKQDTIEHLAHGHQETLPARFNFEMSENGKKVLVGKKRLGIKVNAQGSLLANSLPSEFVKEGQWHRSKALRSFVSVVATIGYILFYPVVVAFMAVIGHFLILIAKAAHNKAGPEIMQKFDVLHKIPYILTPWDLHKLVAKPIDMSHPWQKVYNLFETDSKA